MFAIQIPTVQVWNWNTHCSSSRLSVWFLTSGLDFYFRGIHARPGREKIFSKNVAHVLNDELQRKFIQGLKRLITKAQQYFPTDPSRSIDYVRKEDQ